MNRKVSAAIVGGALLGTLTLTGPSQAATPAPDLTVTAMGWGAPSPVTGQPLLLWATIKNQGNAATPEGAVHGVGFGVGGRTVTWSDTHTQSVAPGQSVTVTANSGPTGSATWAAANATVTAYVDDAKRIRESNDGNNTKTAAVKTAGLSARLNGDGTATVYAPAMPATTGVTNFITGEAYGGCYTDHHRDALLVGTERALGQMSAGGGPYGISAPFAGSGEATVPGSSTVLRVTSNPIDLAAIKKYRQDAMYFSCPAGSWPDWTRLHVKRLDTQRVEPGTQRVLATSTQAVDIDLPM
ncbi:CARDB domain-containing protein [Kineococcus sp. G2]|uniref:CARDB domain-containing protein n=1 Tax=Kineococcus sp. G2 TaxID=3127484 RepID=UPI00301E4EDB